MSDDQRKALREADKERKAKRGAAMTKEEKSAVKEEDRLRKAMKKTSQVDGRTLPRLLAQKKGGLTRPVYDETIVQEKCQGIKTNTERNEG